MSPHRELLQDLVSLPAPPGQEDRVRDYCKNWLKNKGQDSTEDAKGSILWGNNVNPRIVVTAHLDEIALLVTQVRPDGSLVVGPLGGVFAWKWGEGPVLVMASGGDINGVLSFGSIHTAHPTAVVSKAREGKCVEWDDTCVLTGLSAAELVALGVRPGTRVVIHPSRRQIQDLGSGLISGYFFDDRADLAALLEASLAAKREDVLFAATASEEVGGEGANWILGRVLPEICIALEIGPITPDAPAELTAQPTVWVKDSYSSTAPRDLELVEAAATAAGLKVQFQAFSRGGSDASCSASIGLCARPITLAFPAENSHGFEIMHHDAVENLALLLTEVLNRI